MNWIAGARGKWIVARELTDMGGRANLLTSSGCCELRACGRQMRWWELNRPSSWGAWHVLVMVVLAVLIKS